MILVGSTGARNRAAAASRLPPASSEICPASRWPHIGAPSTCTQTRPLDTIGYSMRSVPGGQGGSDMDPDQRHERGLARLAELGDHPGGDAFLERMGSPMADWLVDWT